MTEQPPTLTDTHHPTMPGRMADLKWLLDCPSLMTSPHCSTLSEWLPVYTPPSLPSSPAPTRLGLYAEHLLHHYLAHHPDVVRLLHPLTLRYERRTLGELDFVLLRRDGLCLHIELAVKWYLYVPEREQQGLGAYVGPAQHDTLQRKWRHLLGKQLPVAHSPLATALLKERGFPPINRSIAIVPGQLFYPSNESHWPQTTDSEIAPHHRRGWWATENDLNRLACHQRRYLVLSHALWMAGASPGAEVLLDIEQLKTRCADLSRPVQVVCFSQEEQGRQEQSRGFIVPRLWRQQACAEAL